MKKAMQSNEYKFRSSVHRSKALIPWFGDRIEIRCMAVLLYSFICMLTAELLKCGKMVLPKRSFTLEDVSQALRAANLSAADIPCMMLTSKDFQRLCESLNVEFQC